MGAGDQFWDTNRATLMNYASARKSAARYHCSASSGQSMSQTWGQGSQGAFPTQPPSDALRPASMSSG
jgi:hypothetical protein